VDQRVDFSAHASIYDRRHGAVLALDKAQDLASRGDLPHQACVLDVGADTGCVAIAFAAIGSKTVALDPALPMLNELQRKELNSQIRSDCESCFPALKKWFEDTFDLEQSVPIPKDLRWTIYRKQQRLSSMRIEPA